MSPRPKTGMTEKGLRRKNDLLEAALALFTEKGYRATTITEIAKGAGTGKGTFYWYWRSKEDIFLELLDVKLGSYLDALQRAAKLKIDAGDKIAILIAEASNIFLKYRKLCKLIFMLITEDADAFGGEVRQRTEAFYRQYKKLIAGIFKEGVAAGTLAPDADAAALASLLIAMLDGIAVQEAIFRKEYPIDVIGAAVLRLFKTGVYRQ
jgi:AcrR family transcriptional regulator